MRILVTGKRHDLCRKFAANKHEVFCSGPGNPGIAKCAQVTSKPELVDPEKIVSLALEKKVDLVVVSGPRHFSAGVVDECRKRSMPVVGSGHSTHDLISDPTANYELMREALEAENQPERVKLVQDPQNSRADRKKNTIVKLPGPDGIEYKEIAYTVIPKRPDAKTEGEEISFFIVTDGETGLCLGHTCICKDIGRGKIVPDGVGGIAPHPLLKTWMVNGAGNGARPETEEVINSDLQVLITSRIVFPTLAALRRRGMRYRGILGFKVIVNHQEATVYAAGIKPYTNLDGQLLTPLFDFDLAEVLLATQSNNELVSMRTPHKPGVTHGILLTAKENGHPIEGIEGAEKAGFWIFEMGTRKALIGSKKTTFFGPNFHRSWQTVTNHERVLTVVANGTDHKDARKKLSIGRIIPNFKSKQWSRVIFP